MARLAGAGPVDLPRSPEARGVLHVLGFRPEEERVYRCVLARAVCSVDEIVTSTGTPRDAVVSALAGLELAGLVGRTEDAAELYSALPPEAAVLPLLLRRQEELAEALLAGRKLVDSYNEGRRSSQLVTVVDGPGAVARMASLLMRRATRECSGCDRPPYSRPPTVDPYELAMLARGIRFRVIYDSRAVELQVDNLRRLVGAGEQARVLSSTPVKFMAVDGQVALVQLAAPVTGGDDGGRRDPVGLVVRRSDLLDALLAMFEQQWANAVPLRLADEPADPKEADPKQADGELLALLLAGLTDTAIAGQLGLSRRTVVRRVRALLDRAGVSSRMQLGWHVARAGWLDG